MSNELYHHGVKGMHWGVRRYQNYDGTRIKSGEVINRLNKAKFQARMTTGVAIVKGKQKANKTVDKLADPKTNTKITESKKINDNLKNINKTVNKYTSPRPDLSSMSDQELQRVVNRMNLERNYLQLTNGNTSKGSAYVESVLDFAGDVLAITGSAVAIAVSIKALRK